MSTKIPFINQYYLLNCMGHKTAHSCQCHKDHAHSHWCTHLCRNQLSLVLEVLEQMAPSVLVELVIVLKVVDVAAEDI